MRSASVLPVVGLLLSCTPAAPSQPPQPDAPTTEVTTPPVADVQPDPPEPEPTEQPEADDAAGPKTVTSRPPDPVAETNPEDTGGEATPPAEEATPEDPPTNSGSSSRPASASLELPKPIHGELDAKCGKDPGVGQPLKSFELPTPDGKTISKSTYRGRVLLVNFWGTWCKPCLKELPEFAQLYRRYRKFGLTLLAIATDDDADAVTDVLKKKKIAAKVALGGEAYAGQYGSPKFPFTFVVDHKGTIVASYRGYKPECMGQLEADLREQMKVRAAAKAKRRR